MNDIIASKYQIKIEAKDIQSYLEISVSDNIEEIEQRGHDITVYMARSGKLLADAKHHQDKAIQAAMIQYMKVSLPASNLNKLVASECAEENFLVNWLDRINRGATHQLDWLRSVLSKSKEEIKQNMYL